MNEFLKEQEERNYWLQRGIQAERERIIKLLEAVATEVNRAIIFDSSKSDDLNRQKIAAVCYHLIALIKGEQK